MPDPHVTVLVPVFDRPQGVRHVLQSLVRQSFEDFECIVVDDASTTPIEPVVRELEDDRFRCIRRRENGGPYSARFDGYKIMRGAILLQLDSDNEAYPWTLAQAVHHLDATPEVDAATGMYVRGSDSRLSMRVKGGTRIVTPRDFVSQDPLPDCVGAVRRVVVEEWLRKRGDYFALEAHQWITFSLRHSQLYVDEPWALEDVEGRDRVSLLSGRDERMLDDYVRFLEDHVTELCSVPCRMLDVLLFEAWLQLRRAGRRPEAARAEAQLRRRGVPYRRELAKRALRKGRRRLTQARVDALRLVSAETAARQAAPTTGRALPPAL
jgi:glycosyltransferase involved in cell wall biosynthesis